MPNLAATEPSAGSGGLILAVSVGQWISAALTLIITVALVLTVRWALRRRSPVALATDPGVRTRVRLAERMAVTAIVLIGLAAATAQLGVLRGIASTVLAGSAITAIIVGFAARATLANALAGVVLAITQPLRVGDSVRIGEHEGVVEDVTLSATILRTVHGTTIRVPNEQLAQSVVYNDTIASRGIVPEATILLPYGASVGAAVRLLRELPEATLARVAAVEVDGWTRILVRGERCSAGDRVPAEARLRLAALEALQAAGIILARQAGQEPPQPD